MESLIRRRKETPEFGLGEWRVIQNEPPSVFTHRCDLDAATVVAAHNLSPQPQRVSLEIEDIPTQIGRTTCSAATRSRFATRRSS